MFVTQFLALRRLEAKRPSPSLDLNFDQKGIISLDGSRHVTRTTGTPHSISKKGNIWKEFIVVPQIALPNLELYDDCLGMYVSVIGEKTRRCDT